MAAPISPARPSWSDRFLLRLSSGRSVDGLRVGASEYDGERALDRVEAALGLIKTFDRRRYDRMRHDLERVWVRLLPGPLAQYSAALNACELDTRFVLDEASTAEIIATVIVHEATHARLARCGVRYDEKDRARIEAICVRGERAFAEKLQDGGAALSWVEGHAELSPETFTDAAFAESRHQGGLDVLRHLGTPEWVLRTVLALAAVRRKAVMLRRKLWPRGA